MTAGAAVGITLAVLATVGAAGAYFLYDKNGSNMPRYKTCIN